MAFLCIRIWYILTFILQMILSLASVHIYIPYSLRNVSKEMLERRTITKFVLWVRKLAWLIALSHPYMKKKPYAWMFLWYHSIALTYNTMSYNIFNNSCSHCLLYCIVFVTWWVLAGWGETGEIHLTSACLSPPSSISPSPLCYL